MNIKNYSFLDLVVLFVVTSTIIGAIVGSVFVDSSPNREGSNGNEAWFYLKGTGFFLGMFLVPSLITWMLYGGANSKLWYFLPPFCFFFWCNRLQKWILVMLLVVVVLIGIIKHVSEPF